MRNAGTDSFSRSDIESTYNRLAALVEETAGPDRHYGFWAGPHDNASIKEAAERLTDLVVARLDVGPGSRVLDIGCGNGRPAVRVAQTLRAQVVAIDIDRRALRGGAQYAESRGVGELVDFRRIDAMDLPFAPASFDAVLAFESTPYFDIAHLYRGIAGVLRPGGRLVVETPYPRVPMTEEVRARVGPFLAMLKAVSFDSPDEHSAAARQAGLDVTGFVDITENVQGSFLRLVRGLQERRAHLEAEYGALEIARLLDTFTAWAEATEVGGMIMIFTRRKH